MANNVTQYHARQMDMAALARAIKSPKGQRITAELIANADALTRKDIATWRRAWQAALLIDRPSRSMLYDAYTDSLVDGHLSGAIGQRMQATLGRRFKVVDLEGNEDHAATKLFQRGWFSEFLTYALESIFWGHSLLEMGEVISDDTGMRFADVKLIPRKHVIPEYGVILRDQGDEIRNGIPYREGAYATFLIEVGKPRDLGVLLGCVPNYISKKNMAAFWDTFGEVFGIPMRIAKTTSANQSDIERLSTTMDELGAAFYAVVPDGTDIEIKETSRGDAYQVFDRRIERANSEMSKAVLYQTMTIDNGSSLSQSETHLAIFESLCLSDARMIQFVINDQLIPLMLRLGFPLTGLAFEWDLTEEMTVDERYKTEEMLLQHYEIDPQYFVDRYNIPITGRRGQQEDNQPSDFFA